MVEPWIYFTIEILLSFCNLNSNPTPDKCMGGLWEVVLPLLCETDGVAGHLARTSRRFFCDSFVNWLFGYSYYTRNNGDRLIGRIEILWCCCLYFWCDWNNIKNVNVSGLVGGLGEIDRTNVIYWLNSTLKSSIFRDYKVWNNFFFFHRNFVIHILNQSSQRSD